MSPLWQADAAVSQGNAGTGDRWRRSGWTRARSIRPLPNSAHRLPLVDHHRPGIRNPNDDDAPAECEHRVPAEWRTQQQPAHGLDEWREWLAFGEPLQAGRHRLG